MISIAGRRTNQVMPPAAPRGHVTGRTIVLNRTPETLRIQTPPAHADAPLPDDQFVARGEAAEEQLRATAWRFVTHLSLSSLTRRIIFLNVAGLFAMVIGILYLSQFRAGLIDARVQSLMVQGEIIASAIAASGTIDPDGTTIDPQRLLELQTRRSFTIRRKTGNPGLDFPINPERVAPVLQRLVSPTNTRARIYERDGTFILDSSHSTTCCASTCRRRSQRSSNYFERRFMTLRTLAHARRPADLSRTRTENGKAYEEVAIALTGLKSSMVRINERGEVIVSVAVPVQRFRAVRGALMLSTQGAEIDDMVTAERLAILTRLPDRGGRDDGAVVPARRHHRRSDAAACRMPPSSCAGASSRASRSRTSPSGATRSATCPARCAT